jgi:hypothetical protein
MWQVRDCVSGQSPAHVERFADPGTRRRIVELIREAKQEDERAIEHIESALLWSSDQPENATVYRA